MQENKREKEIEKERGRERECNIANIQMSNSLDCLLLAQICYYFDQSLLFVYSQSKLMDVNVKLN